jgi:D-alanyl-D-alanine carboxypeptidase (penicillin-binding protein 5/6)
MLRFLSVFCLIGVGFAILESRSLEVNVTAESAILYNPHNGAILYEKKAYEPQFPASTTKVATALYALHKGSDRLEKLITADRESLASVTPEAKKRANYVLPSYWLETDGTHIGLKKDEQMRFKDLLAGLLIASGNDASNVIAKEIGGSIPDFIAGLNAYLKDCGCRQTQFYNPHGLHHPKHVTTAYDMALITSKALQFKEFAEIVKSEIYSRPKTNMQQAVALKQTNLLVRKGKPQYYSKAIGVKTGYTSIARHNLVAAARDGKRTLIAVLFKSDSRVSNFTDAKKLFETAFNEAKIERVLVAAGPQDYALDHPGTAKPIPTYVADAASIRYYPSEEPQVKGVLQWKEVNLPVKQGQAIGEIQIQNSSGKVVGIVPLLSQEDVSSTWSYWFMSFFS